ncbi:MAG TPA: TIGR03435 family protein [Elusimicrobiales bacterium]|nr:TIGR03435 family protein [Elusimicrobiales bacterium]
MKLATSVAALIFAALSCRAHAGCGADKVPSMPQALASAWIVLSSDTERSGSMISNCKDEGIYLGLNVPLLSVLASAYGYDIHPVRVAYTGGIDRNARYNYEVRAGTGRAAQAGALWRSLAEASLPVRVESAAEEREVWVLTRTAEKPGLRRIVGHSQDSRYSFRPDKGEFAAEDLRFDGVFARKLEYILDEPVEDETGLSGNWRLELHWTPGDRSALFAALREQAGLRLEKARRTIEIFHVNAFQKPPAAPDK